MRFKCSMGSRMQGLRGELATAAVLAVAVCAVPTMGQQALSPDEAAAVLLNSARLAYNERNYPFAAERFRQYIQKYPSRREAAPARYGLALTLIEGPEKDYNAAIEALTPLANLGDFPDRPYALYYLGLSYRATGLKLMDKFQAQPSDPAPRQQAVQRFTQAANTFANALAAFNGIAKAPPPEAKELPAELEWAARTRCDLAEMQIRLGSPKTALEAVDPLLKDPVLGRSRYRSQAAYYAGYACFLMKDYLNAGRHLASLAPFEDSEIGIHARYLLARTHHLADEKPEAASLYGAIEGGYQAQRKAAEEALKNEAAFKDKPEEKARLQAILSSPPPEYVGKATFHLGVVLQDSAKPTEALARFAAFIQQNPKSPLVPEAQLRVGVCQYQLKQFPQAIQTLTPLLDHPQLGEQALRWTARAKQEISPPTDLANYQKALGESIELFRRAVEAIKVSDKEPETRVRRAEAMLEQADAHQLLKQHKEAAAVYQRIVQENAAPELAEQASHRLVTAYQLAGMYAESDQAAVQFLQRFPKSVLLADVAFRSAENAFLQGVAQQGNAQRAKELFAEAANRYQRVIKSYPGYELLSMAKQGLASSLYQLGKFPEAAAALASIPEPDRKGALANVPYHLADCLMRTLPDNAPDDALGTAKLLQDLETIIGLLSGFVTLDEANPMNPDPTIKLGYCRQRLAELIVDPQEKIAQYTKARSEYSRYLITKFPQHPLYPVALIESAKCLSKMGPQYASAAVKELAVFQTNPQLKASPLAPLAMIRTAENMRVLKQGAQAAGIIAQFRKEQEEGMLKDPARAEYVPALQLAHALALKDAGQFADARAVFDGIVKQFPNRPETLDVPWRLSQCQREEAAAQLEAARKVLAAGGKPEDVQKAQAQLDAAINSLRQTAEAFRSQADKLGNNPEKLNTRLRLLYEAAWCYRPIGDWQIEQEKQKLQIQTVQRIQERISAKAELKGRVMGPPLPPELPVTTVPIQPDEQKARDVYKALIAIGADAPVAIDARFELAELCAQRDEHDQAIALLSEALQFESPQDAIERMRLRLGACLLAKKDAAGALQQFTALLSDPNAPRRSPWAAHARYGAGEALMQQQNWAGAIQQLLPFSENQQLRTAYYGISDRAQLRLGQAYAETRQWEASRKVLEGLVGQFPRSSTVHEARYGIGWAFQNQKQWDNAIAAYNEVVAKTGAQIAARAQIQIGLCRMEQQKFNEALNAFLAAAYTYDYPETTAMALCESARAYMALKQPAEARQMLTRVTREYPGAWAELAQKRLSEIK